MSARVDAWIFPVEHGVAEEASALAMLSPDDAERVAQIGPRADQVRALCARVAARTELGRFLGTPPHLVPLVSTGPPRVTGCDATVSWAHSGEWMALAIGKGLDVGVDIEETPATCDFRPVAHLHVASLEDFVALEAASKATACSYEDAWPPGITVRRLAAPRGYVAAVAAPGGAWHVELHMRSPLEHWDRSHEHTVA